MQMSYINIYIINLLNLYTLLEGEHRDPEVANQPVATPPVRGVGEHQDPVRGEGEHQDYEVASQPVATPPVRGVGDHQGDDVTKIQSIATHDEVTKIQSIEWFDNNGPEIQKNLDYWSEVGTQVDPLHQVYERQLENFDYWSEVGTQINLQHHFNEGQPQEYFGHWI